MKIDCMYCPFCNAFDTKVIDSRLLRENNQVRRRRECPDCSERFTTFETVELNLPQVIKQDGRRAPFNEEKLKRGMLRALEKRPISAEQIELVLARLKRRAMTSGEREIHSNMIGEWVMDELHQLDQVAYVRFASVYRSFKDIKEFQLEIKRLTQYAKRTKSE